MRETDTNNRFFIRVLFVTVIVLGVIRVAVNGPLYANWLDFFRDIRGELKYILFALFLLTVILGYDSLIRKVHSGKMKMWLAFIVSLVTGASVFLYNNVLHFLSWRDYGFRVPFLQVLIEDIRYQETGLGIFRYVIPFLVTLLVCLLLNQRERILCQIERVRVRRFMRREHAPLLLLDGDASLDELKRIIDMPNLEHRIIDCYNYSNWLKAIYEGERSFKDHLTGEPLLVFTQVELQLMSASCRGGFIGFIRSMLPEKKIVLVVNSETLTVPTVFERCESLLSRNHLDCYVYRFNGIKHSKKGGKRNV